METLDPSVGFVMDDDLFNFSLDDEDDKNKDPSSSLELQHPDGHTPSFPEFAEEELEWLSNKDAFPPVETGLDILCQHLDPTHAPSQSNHKSPNSVLENSASSSSNGSAIMSCCVNLQIPGKARSKRRRRRRKGFPDLPGPQYWWWAQVNIKNEKQESPLPLSSAPPVGSAIGRRCQHCMAEKTPQWRAGPMGPKTLCNACGVRYKSGRLVPEYRPASSPTFSSEVHSNSHRKIMEMRKQSQVGGMMVNEACGYRVG